MPTFRRRETTLAAFGNGNTVPESSILEAKRPAREGELSPSSAEVNYPYRLCTPSWSGQKQFRLFTNLPQRRTSVRVVQFGIGGGKLHNVVLGNRSVCPFV